jgi:hypothetical protein
LEFKDCKEKAFLEWNIKCTQNELENCAKYPEDTVALKAVEETNGKIVGYAVWGWSPKVSRIPVYV